MILLSLGKEWSGWLDESTPGTPGVKLFYGKSEHMGFFKLWMVVILFLCDSTLSAQERFSENKKWGLKDQSGRVITPAKYTNIGYFKDGYAVVSIYDKKGMVDSTGELILPVEYTNIRSVVNGMACIEQQGKWGVVNTRGKEILPVRFESVRRLAEYRGFQYLKGYDDIFQCWDETRKPALYNVKGKQIVEPGYTELIPAHRGIILLEKKETACRKYGFADKEGTFVPYKYDYAGKFTDDRALVVLDSQYGYINTRGEEIIPLQYSNGDQFRDGLAPVRKEDKWGYIDVNNRPVTSFKYAAADPFADGVAIVKLAGKAGYINTKGQEITKIIYDQADRLRHSLGVVTLDGKKGFVNRSGEVLAPQFDRVFMTFDNSNIRVQSGDKYGYVDTLGKIIIPVKYDEILRYSGDDCYVVRDFDKFGYFDSRGKSLTNVKYDEASWFSDERARVFLDGKYGYIDKSGKEIIPLIYEEASEFRDGMAKVKFDGEELRVDLKGNVITTSEPIKRWQE